MKRVLLVDPDASSRATISKKFEENLIPALEASNGAEALERAVEHRPDLIVTELILPDITGLNLCRRLREDRRTAAISLVILSIYADEMDRILSFEAGVDDFVAKPFSTNELVARIKAILRRPAVGALDEASARLQRIAATPVSVAKVALGDRVVDATPREIQILAELVRQEGRVVPRQELIERLWAPNANVTTRTIDTHVKSLRRKLGNARACIRTIHGVGYRYDSTHIPVISSES